MVHIFLFLEVRFCFGLILCNCYWNILPLVVHKCCLYHQNVLLVYKLLASGVFAIWQCTLFYKSVQYFKVKDWMSVIRKCNLYFICKVYLGFSSTDAFLRVRHCHQPLNSYKNKKGDRVIWPNINKKQ